MKSGSILIINEFNEFIQTLNSFIAGRNVFVLTDSNVNENLLYRFITSDIGWGDAEILTIEPGEESKSIEICTEIWNHLLECNADNNTLLINIGGGVVTDLGGFVASTFKRGIACINIPTSLLAMVDAAIGGKTGINHNHTKNCIGTIQLPEHTIVCPHLLETLPKHELKSGFAEMLKHALVSDCKHWSDLLEINEITVKNISPFIDRSIAIKEAIIDVDLYEQGPRKHLNLGHTIGHALESYYLEKNNPITHGESVALGLICESQISFRLDKLSAEVNDMIKTGVAKYFPVENFNFPSFKSILTFLINDKKNSAGHFNLSLPIEIGKVEYVKNVPLEVIETCYGECFL